MGKLMHSTQIQHSSHPHLLQLSSSLHLHNHPSATCAGCNHNISPPEHIYTCTPCNFFIHPSCSKFPDLITHPAHPAHTLSLLTTPIYPGGFFRCDACTQHGTRFSYHCHTCDFDLHVLCASTPMRVTHPNHPHPLGLTFASPYGEKLGFSCDVCSRIGSGDQWLYRCVSCEFDVHLQCATAKVPTPPAVQHHHSFSAGGAPVAGQGLTHSMSAPPQALQHHQSFPAGGAPMAGHGLTHSMSAGRIQTQWQPPQTPVAAGVQVQGYQRPVQPPAQVGGQNYTMAPQPAGPAVANQGNGLGNVMVAGFVDGMMQQLGQDFVQTLTGGGGGGGGGGGDVVNIDVQTNVTYEDCGNE
ncbi:uncharacterized protein LOC111903592 [Lactuca sativa]|uniref:DC1 domain-containing protein n=1 Tax=Lactuca sativa TaxID=4236 RepID=A0A9R1UWM6_LACSA|nr:uncharacterized protein LOC111903592 [Lactuca sativa]KAJ0194208.1 hypothetical protein LSAT_V11C800447040 [Lactuca sativa]